MLKSVDEIKIQFFFACVLDFRNMPRKVNYGLDYDDGYDDYDDYDDYEDYANANDYGVKEKGLQLFLY